MDIKILTNLLDYVKLRPTERDGVFRVCQNLNEPTSVSW
jgi:hypothetical protein